MKRTNPRLASIETLVKLARKGADGRNRYSQAADQIRQAAKHIGVSPYEMASVLAVTSPRVSVRRNIRFAVAWLRDGLVSHDMMRGIRASLEHWERTGEIRGPKTRPFAAAILGDGSAIVLDVWMAKAFGIDQKLFSRVGVHKECCRRVRLAAKRLGWSNAETQAAIWFAAVRAAGRKPSRFIITNETAQGRLFDSETCKLPNGSVPF